MANEHQKHENKQENEQPATTPAKPLELSDEELHQITGGADFNPQPDPPGMPAVPTGPGGIPTVTLN
jgi:hypothetical protein